MVKKVLLINGSNRIGNTHSILTMIHEKIEHSELILLKDKKIEYCRGCLACHNREWCIIDDDINEMIPQIIEADLIVFGVPNYFDNISGLFKNFIDRLHPLYKSGFASNKQVIFIYVGGGNEEGTKEELHHSVYGFIKYLKLDLVKEYSFKALHVTDIQTQEERIQTIIDDIESLLKGEKPLI